MKKFLLSDVPFGITTILFAAFTIYEIFIRDEFSLTAIIISFCYFGYLLEYLLKHSKNKDWKNLINQIILSLS